MIGHWENVLFLELSVYNRVLHYHLDQLKFYCCKFSCDEDIRPQFKLFLRKQESRYLADIYYFFPHSCLRNNDVYQAHHRIIYRFKSIVTAMSKELAKEPDTTNKVNYSEEQHDSTDLLAIHDIGLASYWQAKKYYKLKNFDQAATHWKKVIAHWTIVLENKSYWENWCKERSNIYKKLITEEDIKSAKEKLNEHIVAELSKSNHATTSESSYHLEAAYYLETKAIRLLKETEGLLLNTHKRIYCGPLYIEHQGLFQQLKDYLQNHSVPNYGRDNANSMEIISSALEQKGEKSISEHYDLNHQLRLCFSQLGIALIYLEKDIPDRALNVLDKISCKRCLSFSGETPDIQNSKKAWPIQCQKDCPDFARLNPSYISEQNLFYCHARELKIYAHLVSVYHQLFLTETVNVNAIIEHLRDTLTISRVIGIHEAFQETIAEHILSWVTTLEEKKDLDKAIDLIENTIDFVNKKQQFKGKLAGLLNIRGVRRAENEDWEQAANDLRKAVDLNPYVPLFRDNLHNVLQGYASEAYRTGNYALANKLRDEAETVKRGEISDDLAAPQKKEEKPSEMPQYIFAESELANPVLFNRQGLLILDNFDESGQSVLYAAIEQAKQLQEELIGLRALLSALVLYEQGETCRLLLLQDIKPYELFDNTNASLKYSASTHELKRDKTLSQFDFWHEVLDILNLAWDIAQYDRGKIGERHLLYGLLISHRATKLLHRLGINIDRMIKNALW